MPEGLPAPAAAPAAPAREVRPRTGLAWGLVILVVAGVALLQGLSGADPEAAEAFSLEMMEQQVQAQYGTRDFAGALLGGGPAGPLGSAAYDSLRTAFRRGPVAQRQRFAVVAGDMRGPAEARAVLDETEDLLASRGRKLGGREADVQRILRDLYAGDGAVHTPEAAGRIPGRDGETLRAGLGWFGDLALSPAGSAGREAAMEPARRLARVNVGLVVLLLAAGGAGFLGAILFWILVAGRTVRFRLEPGTAPSGIYVETFAVWMVLFLGLSFGAGLLAGLASPGGSGLLPGAVAFLLSLSAAAWPVLRGVPWERVRADAGLRLSATPVRDALAGIACWFMALPVLAGALVVTLVLTFAWQGMKGEPDPLEPTVLPSHPIAGELARGYDWILVLVLAAVLAPLVEETFFRGFLYRHLRDATGRGGRFLSVAIAGLVSSFLFAVIHPQGLLAAPLLMAVAWPLVQAREWRGSLVAPMAAHAWHNALVTLVVILEFGR